MTRLILKNPSGQKVVGQIHKPKSKTNLKTLIYCHGFKGYIDQQYIQYLADKLGQKYCFVCFDFTNGIGESEGDIFDISLKHYLADLETIFEYIKRQDYVDVQNIHIGGSSYGGLVALLFGAKHQDYKSLLLQAPVWKEKVFDPKTVKDFEQKGYATFYSGGKDLEVKVGRLFYDERINLSQAEIAEGIKSRFWLFTVTKTPQSPQNLANCWSKILDQRLSLR